MHTDGWKAYDRLIHNDDGTYSDYGNMKEGSINFEENERIEQGDVFGEVGNTGGSTGFTEYDN
jgi:murein DD-endopeptidase MepM/ murein hydrolase activator NlpD